MITTSDVADKVNTNIDLASTKTTEQIYKTLEENNFALVQDESLTSANISKYTKDLAFLEQKVTFTVGRGGPEDAPVITLGVNGDNVNVVRGKSIRCARKFLNVLIGSTHEMRTEQYQDGNGLIQTRINKKQNPAYHVSIDDDTLEGRNWFQNQQRLYYI